MPKKTRAKKASKEPLPVKASPPARATKRPGRPSHVPPVDRVLLDIVGIVEEGRRAAARSVNTAMTATYWAVGRRIIIEEQAGRRRATYGKGLIDKLVENLVKRCGRGFGARNLLLMRSFYLAYPQISQAASAELAAKDTSSNGPMLPQSAETPIPQALSAELRGDRDVSSGPLLRQFALPWSH